MLEGRGSLARPFPLASPEVIECGHQRLCTPASACKRMQRLCHMHLVPCSTWQGVTGHCSMLPALETGSMPVVCLTEIAGVQQTPHSTPLAHAGLAFKYQQSLRCSRHSLSGQGCGILV